MRNITGSPVEGGDFFDRQDDLERFFRELRNDGHLLLISPRRVGKTSFILRLCEHCRSQDWSATFFNVEACNDELDFAKELVEALRETGVEAGWLPRLADCLHRIRRSLGPMKVGIGVDVELHEIPELEDTTLSQLLESILAKIEAGQKTVLVAVDELPEMLLAIARQEHGAERVERLLHWLRRARQTIRHRVRWLFLGSIGLDTFVDDRNLRKTINDLMPMPLGAFSADVADDFLRHLADDNGLEIDRDVRQHVVERIGWPLPYHLQLAVHALIDLECRQVSKEDVERAVEHLLRPESFCHFDTWRQRLKDQLSVADARAAFAILKFLCQHPEGRTRAEILDALMAGRPAADVTQVDDQIGGLLVLLQRDGYLIEQDGNYAFRSFLLREFWYRRDVR
jgi:hypothetical protein